MVTKENLRKLTDFVLLNAYSVSSTGLYNGKAGMSLCLFEVARATEDELLEEHAFELLQEALLTKNTDIDFENGLSGVGFVLRYLIDNEFIDADFEEMFGEQTQKILDGLEKRRNEPTALMNSIKMIYLLSDMNRAKADKRITDAIHIIFDSVESYLLSQFADFNSLGYKNIKMAVLGLFEDYVRLLCYSKYTAFSRPLLERYFELYRTGKIVSSFSIGCYLEILNAESLLSESVDVISANKELGLQNMNPDTLSLRELTVYYQLLHLKAVCYRDSIAVVAMKLHGNEKINLEQAILSSIPKDQFTAGYGCGVARLLLMSVNLDAALC